MNTHPIRWLICYDIADDKRRRAVYRTLRGHGTWVQFSVFRASLSPMRLERLLERLEGIIHHREDQVLMVRLGRADSPQSWRIMTLGKAMAPPSRNAKVV